MPFERLAYRAWRWMFAPAVQPTAAVPAEPVARGRYLADHVAICTDDGSAGFKGFVTQQLERFIAGEGPGRPDYVVAIGPMAMMRAVAETTRAPKVKTLVSMDPLMVDGTGMCGGCRVMVGGRAQFACVDGPCFDGHEVDFDVAMRRNKAYVKQEKQAVERLDCARSGSKLANAA